MILRTLVGKMGMSSTLVSGEFTMGLCFQNSLSESRSSYSVFSRYMLLECITQGVDQ